MSKTLRLVPAALIVALMAAGLVLAWRGDLSWQALASEQVAWRRAAEARPIFAGLIYMAVYAVAVAASFPGVVVITMIGGMLFGIVIGAALTVFGATTGAVTIFVVARSALAPWVAARSERTGRTAQLLNRVRPRLQRDGLSYLLALRLLPLMPFWMLNLVAATSGVRLRDFVIATFFGIIPACLVYASIGAGLDQTLRMGPMVELTTMLRPAILLPLVALAALAMTPVLWRMRRGHENE
jgi:uncharacterized membrane protein YdjX (TVP38/TMEM64 family)